MFKTKFVIDYNKDLEYKLSNFAVHLLSLDKRIELFDVAGDMSDFFTNTAYIVNKNNILFAAQIPYASHEIAHMVEMSDFNRCLKSDWGFQDWSSEKVINNTPDNTFFKGIVRELKVRGIQRRIDNTKNFSYNNLLNLIEPRIPYGKFNKVSSECKQNICNFDVNKPRIPYQKFNKIHKDCKKNICDFCLNKKSIIDWMISINETSFKQYNLDRIEHEWKNKLNFIFNWMETK